MRRGVFIKFFVGAVILAFCFFMGEVFLRFRVKVGLSGEEFVSIFRKSSSPQLSYEMKPSFRKVLPHLDAKVIYETNSWGFRGGEFKREKDPAKVRIAVLGDSIAFGIGIDYEQTFPRLLERSLRGRGVEAEVYNFGVVGYNTIQEYELLKTVVFSTSPDIIILGYTLNDAAAQKDWEFEPNAGRIGLKHETKPRSFIEQLQVYNLVKRVIERSIRREKSFLGDSTESALYEGVYGQEGGTWSQRSEYILKIKELTEQKETNFLMIVSPLAYQVEHFGNHRVAWEKITTFARESKIAYVDLLSGLRDTGVPVAQLFVDESHLSVKGNAIISDIILAQLEK